MRIGAFEAIDEFPELREPHVIANLHPWLDAGSAGTLALQRLERHYNARLLAKLAKPGMFFDFTRYRPLIHYEGDQRVFTVPNCNAFYARSEDEQVPDLVFLHLLEPHAFAEDYIEALLELLKAIGAKRLCRLGAMWDAVPHTRPLRVTQTIRGQPRPGNPPPGRRYEGPTSIMNLFTEGAEALGIENVSLMVRLPYYARLEEDYMGVTRLLEALNELYPFPPSIAPRERAQRQYNRVTAQVEADPAAKEVLSKLEAAYDAEEEARRQQETPPLSPEIERFLRELNERLGGN